MKITYIANARIPTEKAHEPGGRVNEEVMEKLNKAVDNSKNFFAPGYESKLRRFLKHPIRVIIRAVDIRLFNENLVMPVRVKTFFGYPMYALSYDHNLVLCGFNRAPQELRLTRFIIKSLNPGDVFFDIGANSGFFSLLVHKLLNGSGAVHAFEPSPFHFKILARNGRYPRMILNKKAVFSHTGELEFYENNKLFSTINVDFFKDVDHYKKEKFKKIEVPAIDLDTYCASKNVVPSFMKIDAEGAEFDVLMGAQTILREGKPVIMMEVLRSPHDHTNHDKAIELLASLGYKPFRILAGGGLEPLADLIPDRDIPFELGLDNFVFKK